MTQQDEDAVTISGPAPGGVGILILDMINDFAFPGAEGLHAKAVDLASAIVRLRTEADALGTPAIYVNDNYGQWHSEKAKIVAACARPDSPGRDVVERVAPRPNDYFVIKPQFSGFYATSLPVLLPKLGVSRLILCGVAADICVLFTAADAHMREYGLWAPRDLVASEDDRRTDWALDIMRKSMGAETRSSRELSLADWIGAADR
ncbi:MAG TPA: isochorismatase family cysteine hydrolase [Caulobacteraceae bacterium]|jgi:nicotinamidase-related amidase|nr:isochorismatase family cysteine hydrolase [Caulobacteraceae bacterium]